VNRLNSYASPTPVLEAGRLYAHFGTFGAACLDTKSGKVLWTNHDLKLMHENGPGSSPAVVANLFFGFPDVLGG
jgi:outer membrane protein assembly factor BamB